MESSRKEDNNHSDSYELTLQSQENSKINISPSKKRQKFNELSKSQQLKSFHKLKDPQIYKSMIKNKLQKQISFIYHNNMDQSEEMDEVDSVYLKNQERMLDSTVKQMKGDTMEELL